MPTIGTAIDYSNLITTNPSRFTVINPALLAPMAVLEALNSELIIAARMQQLKALWMQKDPPNAAQYDVENLEFDPLKINQETGSFFELLLRDRVNQACRAVTLAFAVGADLDAIGSIYPYGVPRNANELDATYRQRIWLSPNIFSLNGPGMGVYESYVFWALNAPIPATENPIVSAGALTKERSGIVTIPIMNGTPFNNVWQISLDGDTWVLNPGTDPIPTAAQIAAVFNYITERGVARKGLTDEIQIVAPKVTPITVNANVWTYPGVDRDTSFRSLAPAVFQFIQSLYFVGTDLTRMALDTIFGQQGIFKVVFDPDITNTDVGPAGCINFIRVQLAYQGSGQ